MIKTRWIQLLLILTITTTSVVLSCSSKMKGGGEVKWHPIEKVEELVRQNPKKIYIDLYTDWCTWCKVMDKNTFTDDSVAYQMNTNFYSVKFNAESTSPVKFKGHNFEFVESGKRGFHQLAYALAQGELAYPNSIILNEDLEILQVIPGYLKANELLPILKYFGNDIYKHTSFEEFIKE